MTSKSGGVEWSGKIGFLSELWLKRCERRFFYIPHANAAVSPTFQISSGRWWMSIQFRHFGIWVHASLIMTATFSDSSSSRKFHQVTTAVVAFLRFGAEVKPWWIRCCIIIRIGLVRANIFCLSHHPGIKSSVFDSSSWYYWSFFQQQCLPTSGFFYCSITKNEEFQLVLGPWMANANENEQSPFLQLQNKLNTTSICINFAAAAEKAVEVNEDDCSTFL